MQRQHQNQSIIDKAYVLLIFVPFGLFMGALALDGWVKKRQGKKRRKSDEAE